jgi:UDP-N-acetylglucosamine--N-acetylmuramyl-(pentapeptide) pyrophosphoryl-undecaprenol N-acetylglucosamine transferase
MTTALVCSGGGHLKQLSRLVPRMGLDDELVWVTFETGLSKWLLDGQDVRFVRYTKPRDYAGVLRLVGDAERLVRDRKIDRVISTGANLALSFLPSTLSRRRDFHYVESAARADAPSATGRVMVRTPGVCRYAQYPWFDSRRWRHVGSVFDSFRAGERREAAVRRVVVTAGTTDSYGFRRLFARLAEILPPEAEVLWQTGSTDVSGLGFSDVRPTVPPLELVQAIAEADVVVSHAGAGSALAALEVGRCPVLVPRQAEYGEHVDDHQQQVARELDARGLAARVAVDDLDLEVLLAASSRSVDVVPEPAPFRLVRPSRKERR